VRPDPGDRRRAHRRRGTPEELKRTVAGDTIALGTRCTRPAPAATAQLAAAVPGATGLDVNGSVVRFRVPHASTALPVLLRELEATQITLESVEVHRPILDDVFLTLTGRSLRDAESGAPSATPDTSPAPEPARPAS